MSGSLACLPCGSHLRATTLTHSARDDQSMRTVMTFPLFVVLASAQIGALAQDKPPRKVVHDVMLDIDRDGRMDRAVLVGQADGPYVDLWIYLRTGDELLDLSRRPDFVKDRIADDPILAFESKGGGSLIINSGRQMRNNSYEKTLTIVHRRGRFWVAGFTAAWETQQGMGSCDINFLTGRGVASRGLAGSRPLKARFSPITLESWSPDRQPRAC